MIVYLRLEDAGTKEERWKVCAKNDPGAVKVVLVEELTDMWIKQCEERRRQQDKLAKDGRWKK